MASNVLIGAISGNYTIEDVQGWVETSNFEGVDRVLLMYNSTTTLENYLVDNNVKVVVPTTDFWKRPMERFETNTGLMNLVNSYDLVHNVRFLHIWKYLKESSYTNVFITDVRDVYFNDNPFEFISKEKITATSEVLLYNDDHWNRQHLYENLGEIGLELLISEPVYNVGAFGGPVKHVIGLCADVYLMSVGKPRVADQTSFNYLINTKYKDIVNFTDLSDKLAVHLAAVAGGLVEFDLDTVEEYKIIHQYDRIKGFSR